MPAKKVLINAMHLYGNFSGVHRYAEKLIQHLRQSKYQIDSLNPDDRLAVTNHKHQSYFSRARRVWYEQTGMNRKFSTGNYDLYHGTNYVLPFIWNAPSILTVHDTIALDYPEFCKNETAIYYGLLLKKSIKKTIKVLAVSDHIKEDIIRHTSIAEDRIIVTHLGVDRSYSSVQDQDDLLRVVRQYNLPKRYCLFVGNLEPKKNLPRLIQAFHKLLPQLNDSDQLIIAGQRGWKYHSIYKTIERLKIQSRVRLIGYVPQNDLPALYSLASVFAFPSLYEGFGLPAIEAMSCGTPVLISDRGSLPEITGGFARQVNPLDVNDMSIGLFEQLTQPNVQQMKNGQEWVKQFRWETTASKTEEVYEEVLELHPGKPA